MLQEVDHKLTWLSDKYAPHTPERDLDQVAKILRENVESMGIVIEKLQAREEQNLATSRMILEEFRDTSNGVISSLAARIEAIQIRTEQTALDLKEAVTSSLRELKERFIEISQSWRAELHNTIQASEQAAQSLSQSSENLVAATNDVAASLQDVRESLEKTKDLSLIVGNIERLTQTYLTQTEAQIETFGKGLNDALALAQTIPDEWFTMLDRRNNELTEKLTDITTGWKTHITGTSEEWSTKLTQVSTGLEPLVGFLAPDGQLFLTLNEFHSSLVEIREWFDRRSKTDIAAQLDVLNNSIVQLERTLSTPPASNSSIAATPPASQNGLASLTHQVEGIHSLLSELLSQQQSTKRIPESLPTRVEPSTNKTSVNQLDSGNPPTAAPLINELRAISAILEEINEAVKNLRPIEPPNGPPTEREKRWWPWRRSQKYD